jgi:hypothetical protein
MLQPLAPGEGRVVVHSLREVCLGLHPTVPVQVQKRLIDEGFMMEDGTVVPEIKKIVLASVRGEESGLFLVSPFVSHLDRTLCDLLISQENVREYFPEDQAQLLFQKGEKAGNLSGWQKEPPTHSPWVNRVFGTHDPNEPPPFS